MYSLYRWLYSRVGGRPWTHILAEAADEYTLPFLLGAFALGVVFGPRLDPGLWVAILGGILVGHLFWGPWGFKR